MPEPSFIRPDDIWREIGLRADQVIVHLGCGPGFYLIPAARIVGKHGKAIGVDILTSMLEEVEGRSRHANVGETVQTVRANLEDSSGSTLPPDSADWVLVANILHQSNPEKILQEAHRLLRAAGKVVIIEWDTAATPLGPPADKRVPESHVRALAEQLGLALDRAFKPSPYHYGLIFSEKV